MQDGGFGVHGSEQTGKRTGGIAKMPIRIKNWSKFQHFKDRRPVWIKLYRDLLDDMEWHRLDAEAAKALVLLWLIAADKDGELPDITTLAFRLRTSETTLKAHISSLSHWLISDDIGLISDVCQNDILEKRRDREETEKNICATQATPSLVGVDVAPLEKKPVEPFAYSPDFEAFWKAYPRIRRTGKMAACRKWNALKKSGVLPPLEKIMKAVDAQTYSTAWRKDNGAYVPAPEVWLNKGRWDDYEEANER
jgi:hypothetical protein